MLSLDDTLDLPTPAGDGLVQLFEPEHWAWMVRMPEALAKPLGVLFFR
jgi:hypothetical protein